MMSMLRKLWVEEEGQSIVEYALIVALIAVAVIAAMTFLRGKIQTKFSTVGSSMDTT